MMNMHTVNTQLHTKTAMFIDDDQATNVLHCIGAQNVRLADSISTHTSATLALEELKYTPESEFPSFLFVDVSMPGVNGHEFMDGVKKLKGYDPKQTCVVFVTGSLDIRDMVMADENDVHCYKFKPLTQNDFLELRGCNDCAARNCG